MSKPRIVVHNYVSARDARSDAEALELTRRARNAYRDNTVRVENTPNGYVIFDKLNPNGAVIGKTFEAARRDLAQTGLHLMHLSGGTRKN